MNELRSLQMMLCDRLDRLPLEEWPVPLLRTVIALLDLVDVRVPEYTGLRLVHDE